MYASVGIYRHPAILHGGCIPRHRAISVIYDRGTRCDIRARAIDGGWTATSLRAAFYPVIINN
jgi:hypothetical protein